MTKLNKTLLRLDLFGETVGFKIDGHDSKNSWPGLLLSVCIFATIVAYTAVKYVVMVTHNGTQIIEFSDPEGKKVGDKTKIDGLSVGFFLYDLSRDAALNTQDYLKIEAMNFKEANHYGLSDNFSPITVGDCTIDDFEKVFPDVSNGLL